MLIKCGKCYSYFKWCDIGVKWLCEKKIKKFPRAENILQANKWSLSVHKLKDICPRQRESGRETAQQMIINHMKLQL